MALASTTQRSDPQLLGMPATENRSLDHSIVKVPPDHFEELVALIPMTCEPGPGDAGARRYGSITKKFAFKNVFSTGSLWRPDLKSVHGVTFSFRDPRSLFVELVTLIPMTCEPGPGDTGARDMGQLLENLPKKGTAARAA